MWFTGYRGPRMQNFIKELHKFLISQIFTKIGTFQQNVILDAIPRIFKYHKPLFGKKFLKITKNSKFAQLLKIVNFANCFVLHYLVYISLHAGPLLGQYLILLQRYGEKKLSQKCCAESAILTIWTTLKNNSTFHFEVLSTISYFKDIL